MLLIEDKIQDDLKGVAGVQFCRRGFSLWYCHFKIKTHSKKIGFQNDQLERKHTISDPAFKISRLTSRVSALMSNITNPEALTRSRPFTPPPPSLLRSIHQSGCVQLVLILPTACSDLPVLVGVQSVEEIVTAVLPRSVRELQGRQQWEVRAVFTHTHSVLKNLHIIKIINNYYFLNYISWCQFISLRKKYPLITYFSSLTVTSVMVMKSISEETTGNKI